MFGHNHKGKKFIQKRNRWELSTGNDWLDLETMRAVSYGWWCYLKLIKGKLVFNNYSYSNTTSNHQSDTRSILKNAGIKIDYVVKTVACLDHFESEALEPLYRKIFRLEIEMKRKGSRKDQTSRLREIESLKQEIVFLRELGAKFSRKQQKELKTELLDNENRRVERLEKEREEKKARGIKTVNPDKLLLQTTQFNLVV